MDEYISKLEMNLEDLTVLEALKLVNDDERVPLDHETYMQIARIGTANDYIGVDWIRWLYQRNLIIYKNILDLIDNSDDRILVIIGSGHRHLITQFLLESDEVVVEKANNFL